MSGPCHCGTTHVEDYRKDYRTKGTIEATYDYRNENGELLYQAVRFAGKQFKLRRPDGAGAMVWGLNGSARTIYRLPEIVEDDADRTVYVVEGEKDADTLAKRGFLATTNSEGAGKWNKSADVARTALRDRDIVIIADADAPGRAHARQVEASLRGVARSLRVTECPAPYKDATALLQAGGSLEQLVPLSDEAPMPPEAEPANENASVQLVRCMTADEFFTAESAADLVVPSLGICPGPPTGLVGQAYVGKTITALSFGMSVALGKDLWGIWSVSQGPWLHMDYEQGRRHTKNRIHRLARGFGVSDEELRSLIADGAIRIAVMPDLRLGTEHAVDHYKRTFQGVRLVTCDSLRVMLGGVDENSSQVRSLISVLSVASDTTGAAVGLIHHGGKTPLDGERARKETPRGSSGIVDELQSLFVMTKKKGEAVALVTHEKDRELGEPVADFGLRIDDVPTDDGDLKGGLRVVHVDRDQVKGKARDDSEAKFSRVAESIRQCVASNPGIAGAETLRSMVGGAVADIRGALAQLIADGHVVERPTPGRGRGRRLYLAGAAPAEAT
ncbi:MAG: AAA family ATPase [Myxococcota bacterium]|nr:AAA family ATPase [Myxococcota bacterium]